MRKIRALIIFVVISLLFFNSCGINRKRHFKGIRIIFFAGGFKDDVISSIIYNGAKQAEKDFGCSIEYVFSNWDPNRMLDDFKDAIEKKPDGICVMGHPGDSNLLPLVDEAVSKEIIVTTQNVEVPTIEDKYLDKGFGYVGQNTYKAGYNLAKLCIKRMNIKQSDKVAVWGALNSQGRKNARTTGNLDCFAENKIKADFFEMKVEARASPLTKGYEDFLNYYDANPDLKLLIVNGGVLTGSIKDILKKAGIPPKKIKCAGYDLTEGSIAGIKEGYLEFVNDQQPFLQGYLPILQICLTKKYGFSGLHINTDSSYVDDSNAVFFENLVREKIR
jgi:simple sugar transport system substrate-binding protein